MDPLTGATILGAIWSKDMLQKFLGPSAEYLGEEFRDHFVKKRFENIKNIFSNGEKKLGDRINQPGSVPPKVLRGIVNEGSYADDFLSVEYFGGVLASSRSGISRDDRGAYYNALISRLSTYQLRTHYLFYHSLKKVYGGMEFDWSHGGHLNQLRILIPYSAFSEALDITEEEGAFFPSLLDHILYGLSRENLIQQNWEYGNAEDMPFPDAKEGGIILKPDRPGLDLFYWAYGLGNKSVVTFFNKDLEFELDEKIKIDDRIKSANTGRYQP